MDSLARQYPASPESKTSMVLRRSDVAVTLPRSRHSFAAIPLTAMGIIALSGCTNAATTTAPVSSPNSLPEDETYEIGISLIGAPAANAEQLSYTVTVRSTTVPFRQLTPDDFTVNPVVASIAGLTATNAPSELTHRYVLDIAITPAANGEPIQLALASALTTSDAILLDVANSDGLTTSVDRKSPTAVVTILSTPPEKAAPDGDPFLYTVEYEFVFSEAVTGLDATDIQASAGTVTEVRPVVDGTLPPDTTYRVTLELPSDQQDEVTVALDGTIIDSAGNPVLHAEIPSWQYDIVAPTLSVTLTGRTVSINEAANKATQVVTFAIVESEPLITPLSLDSFTFVAQTPGGESIEAVSVSTKGVTLNENPDQTTTYLATVEIVSPLDQEEAVLRVMLDNDTEDLHGNDLMPLNEAFHVVDTVAPSNIQNGVEARGTQLRGGTIVTLTVEFDFAETVHLTANLVDIDDGAILDELLVGTVTHPSTNNGDPFDVYAHLGFEWENTTYPSRASEPRDLTSSVMNPYDSTDQKLYDDAWEKVIYLNSYDDKSLGTEARNPYWRDFFEELAFPLVVDGTDLLGNEFSEQVMVSFTPSDIVLID